MRRMSRSCSVLVLILCAGAVGLADNWPQWRGPGGDGACRETNIPTRWSMTENVAWKTPIAGWGNSTPVVWDDAVFLTTQVDTDLQLLRIDAQTGKIVWTRNVGRGEARREGPPKSAKFHTLHNLASPSCATDGESVIVHFGTGDLACYDFAGTQRWARNLAKDYGAYTIWWGHANSPVLAGNLVISVCMQDPSNGGKSYLVAHDKMTGAERWKVTRATGAQSESADAYTTPLLLRRGERQEFVVMGGECVDAYDPATGKRLWYVGGLAGNRTITGPAAGDDTIFVTRGMRGPLVAVAAGGSGDVRSSHLRWSYTGGATPDTPCPVYANGLVFFASDNGVATCVDAKTGALCWKERLGGDFKASLVAAAGQVYFLDRGGRTTVVPAAREFSKTAVNDLKEEAQASPAISNGRLFLRTRQHLWAIGGR